MLFFTKTYVRTENDYILVNSTIMIRRKQNQENLPSKICMWQARMAGIDLYKLHFINLTKLKQKREH